VAEPEILELLWNLELTRKIRQRAGNGGFGLGVAVMLILTVSHVWRNI
jgi:hypothetical protein